MKSLGIDPHLLDNTTSNVHGLRVIFLLGSCCKSEFSTKERTSMSLAFIYCFHVLRRQRNYSNRGSMLLLIFLTSANLPDNSKCRIFLWGTGWKLILAAPTLCLCCVVSHVLVSCHSHSGLCHECYCLCVFIMENWNYTSQSWGQRQNWIWPSFQGGGGWPQMREWMLRTLKMCRRQLPGSLNSKGPASQKVVISLSFSKLSAGKPKYWTRPNLPALVKNEHLPPSP